MAGPPDLPEQPPSWDYSVEQYLANNRIQCDRAVPIAEGHSAYVWMLEGVMIGDVSSRHSRGKKMAEICVLKYGDATIKAASEYQAPPAQMLMEARALQSSVVATASRQEPLVQVPSVIHAANEALLMSWAGDITLRDAYKRYRSLDVQEVGRRLGTWIGALHLAGMDAKEEIREWSNEWNDDIVRREIDHMQTTLANIGTPEDIINRTVALFNDSSLVQTLSPFDFRPMNTLLQEQDHMAQPGVLTVVDWECSKCGDPAFDVRIWIAEVLILESKSQFAEGRPLLSSFLAAYKSTVGSKIIDTAFVSRVAILVGSILNFALPFPPWDCTEEEDVAHWKAVGAAYIEAGVTGNLGWLAESPLGVLMDVS